MKAIVCVEDRGGMLFNNRRLSKDRVLTADVISDLCGQTLYLDRYSLSLFKDSRADVRAVEQMFTQEGVYFVENRSLAQYADKIDSLVIYKWNRAYPFDMQFDIDLQKSGFKLVKVSEFAGNSHDKITKEEYVK